MGQPEVATGTRQMFAWRPHQQLGPNADQHSKAQVLLRHAAGDTLRFEFISGCHCEEAREGRLWPRMRIVTGPQAYRSAGHLDVQEALLVLPPHCKHMLPSALSPTPSHFLQPFTTFAPVGVNPGSPHLQKPIKSQSTAC